MQQLDDAPPAWVLEAEAAALGEGLPSVIPDWVLEDRPLPEAPRCDCACTFHDGAVEPSVAPAPSGVSPAVVTLQSAVSALADVTPAALSPGQALADGGALLEIEQQLRILNLQRVGDVGARGLAELEGFRSAKAWVRAHRPDGDAGDAALAVSLRGHHQLEAAVREGSVPLASSKHLVKALRRMAPHLDRSDGLIDGQPGDQVLDGVVRHVLSLVCRHLLGLEDDDARLAALVRRAQQVLEAGGQADVIEAAVVWLAQEIPSRHLAGPLDEIVVTVLPNELEDRAERGQRNRALGLTPKEDGTGWHLCGDLDLECGERLFTALRAEAARDPHNPDDTAAWAGASEEDKDLWRLGAGLEGVSDTGAWPRNRRQRLHDAFSRVLGRYLNEGFAGTSGKVPVQISVTITEQAVAGAPGSGPARSDSGRLVPRSLVRRWWCDSSVTAFVMSLGGRALRVVHSQRTLSGDERRALRLEGGDRCAGDGCCMGRPDPLTPTRPHHVLGYAEDKITSLDETLPVCDVLHRDLHEGKRTVRLRDGRYLNERGFVDHPSLYDHPPF